MVKPLKPVRPVFGRTDDQDAVWFRLGMGQTLRMVVNSISHHLETMVLGVDSPFFSTIVLFKTSRFPWDFDGFLKRKIPGQPVSTPCGFFDVCKNIYIYIYIYRTLNLTIIGFVAPRQSRAKARLLVAIYSHQLLHASLWRITNQRSRTFIIEPLYPQVQTGLGDLLEYQGPFSAWSKGKTMDTHHFEGTYSGWTKSCTRKNDDYLVHIPTSQWFQPF